MQNVKRPRVDEDEIVRAVAAAMAPAVERWVRQAEEDCDTLQELEQSLYRAWRLTLSWDAYQLAKRLESDGWIADADLVEALRKAEGFAYQTRAKATRAWLEQNGIVAAFGLGDEVEFDRASRSVDGLDGPVKSRGTVVSVDPDHGQYLVRVVTRQGHVDAYVLFENARKPEAKP